MAVALARVHRTYEGQQHDVQRVEQGVWPCLVLVEALYGVRYVACVGCRTMVTRARQT